MKQKRLSIYINPNNLNNCTRREAILHLAYSAMTLFRAMKLRFLHHAVGSMWWVACTTSEN